MRAIQVL